MTTTVLPRPCPHPLRAESRHSVAPWAAIAVFLTLAIVMVAKADHWQGSWGTTRITLHSAATVLGGPLVAAIGCWHGGRERRCRTDALRIAAARSPLAQFAVAALPVMLAVVVGYVLAAAGTVAASWPYASAGPSLSPLVLPVVADAVFLAATTAGAMVVGRLVRWRPAAPVLAGLTYAVLALPAYRGTAVRFLIPSVEDGLGEALPAWWQPVAMAGWTGGLAVAAVLAYAARRRWAGLLPLAAAACAAVLLVQAGDRAWRPDPVAARQVCDDSAPRVCVNALDKNLLPQVSRALSGITGRLAGVRNAPVRFEDLRRAPGPDEAQLPQLFRGQSVVRGQLADPERFAWEAAAELTARGDACEAAQFDQVDSAVRDWLVSNGLSDRRRASWARLAREQGDEQAVARSEAGARALRRLASMGEERRRVWLSRYFASRGSCDAREVPRL
ncbi:hypothetical protein [Streptomyces rimosus]|uniref:hypothetical protein n=1 Tax=Streptomyces rimosus TaxID=1927 RepID=UPI0004BE6C50|nr:hypothetical protein [Streptomyces rimosus]